MAYPEQRSHTRAPLQPLGLAATFAAAHHAHTPGTVRAEVLDISEGGVQIQSRTGLRLTGKSFHLQVVVRRRGLTDTLDGGEIQCVWSHSGRVYSRSGFLVRAESQALSALVQDLQGANQHVLHCMLHPVVAN